MFATSSLASVVIIANVRIHSPEAGSFQFSQMPPRRELAARGHYPMMVEVVLRANGFPEAAEWIDQPHIYKELKDIAERARKEAVGLSTTE